MADPLRQRIVARLRTAGCVFAEDEADILLVTSTDHAVLATMIERRAMGVPLEQVVGWAEFCGVRLFVTEGVFVPRPRSALLVEKAAERAEPDGGTGQPVVVDMCCGTGAIGAVIATRVPGIRLSASDMDPAAVRCARANFASLTNNGVVYEGDLFSALPETLRGRIRVLVANVPYVPTDELELLPRDARRYEPRAAFDGGADGLAVLRRVVAGTALWLAPGGWVLMETSSAQARSAIATMTSHGLSTSVCTDSGLGATVVLGRRASH